MRLLRAALCGPCCRMHSQQRQPPRACALRVPAPEFSSERIRLYYYVCVLILHVSSYLPEFSSESQRRSRVVVGHIHVSLGLYQPLDHLNLALHGC